MSSSSTASWPPPPLGAMDGDSFGDEDGEGDCAEAGGARQPQYTEYPIGHPMRRPHWGVPLRFDIRQIVALRLCRWAVCRGPPSGTVCAVAAELDMRPVRAAGAPRRGVDRVAI